jgi:O-antigen ligase
MRSTILGLRRRLPRAPRLEHGAFGAVALAVAALPFDDVLTWLFSVPFVAAVLLDLARGLRRWRWPLFAPGLTVPLVLLAAFALASIFWAESPRHTWKLWCRDFGRWALMLLLVRTHVTSRSRLKTIVTAFVAGALVCSVVGIAQRIQHGDVENYRVFGTFGHPNHCADLLTAALLLVAAYPVAGRRALAGRLLLAAPLVATLFFTLSRGAWLAAAVGLGTLGLLRNRRLLAAGAAAVLILVLLGLLLPSSYVGDRIRGLVFPDRFVSALHDRPVIWKLSLRLVAERPWLGHGWGHKNFHHAWLRLEDRPDRLYGSAHNTPLHILFELGVVGLLLHAWIYGAVLVALVRGYRAARDPTERGVLSAVLGIAAGWGLLAFTVEHLLLEQMMVVVGTVMGLGLAAAGLARGAVRGIEGPDS